MDGEMFEDYPGTWTLDHVRRQYRALMEVLAADAFSSGDHLYVMINARAAELGVELDKRSPFPGRPAQGREST